MITSDLKHASSLLFDFRAGNEQAFDQIFNHFYQPLCFFAVRIVHDKYLAEDLAQETLIKVWQKRIQFEDIGKLKSFLYISVRNACFDQLDKEKVRQKHQDFLQSGDEPAEQTVLQYMMQAEVVAHIFSMVDTLPEQCRKVIRMTFDEGKKPKEIAEELGITVSTVNSQKMRGLSLLKGKLSDKDFLTALLIFLPEFWK